MSTIISWRSEQRRLAILTSARRLFLRDGYQCTAMDVVADEANVSKATIYKKFASKSDLFVAVCEEETRRTLGTVFEAIDLDGDFRITLTTLAHRILAVLLSDDLIAFHRLVVAETVNFPGIGSTAYEFGIRRCAERVTMLFDRAAARGELKAGDTAAAASQFLALCLGRSYWQRLFGVRCDATTDEIDQDAARAVATFLAAFSPSTERL